MILEATQEMLESLNYQILTATDGQLALEIFKERSKEIDLIILDLGLPKLSGAECLQQLLQIEPKAKIILATGYAANEMAKDPEKYGACASLKKPFSLDQLQKRIQEVLSK